MEKALLILIIEAMAMYFLVLAAHSLRHRFGSVHFYALLGGITAIMSWVTDAGVVVTYGGITFVIGSTVFYTSLLLGVFVVYVYDGPRATRIAISTIVGVSAMVPVIAACLHLQMALIDSGQLPYVPLPSLRINLSSVAATLIDLVFLAMAWEYFGRPNLGMRLWMRAFFTLLGVMWLDVVVFGTLAFGGTEHYLNIVSGTMISRFFVAVLALPFLYGYLAWQNTIDGVEITKRPVLAILKRFAEVESELADAQLDIARRRVAEKERDKVIAELESALAEVKTLRGLLPICAHCKKIRDDEGIWNQVEAYVSKHAEVDFSHSICPDCMDRHFPEYGQAATTPGARQV